MDRPYLDRLENSRGNSSKAIIFIRGYLSENNFEEATEDRWKQALRQAGWNGSIYHLWWESGGDSWKHYRFQLRWEQIKSKAKRVGRDYLNDLVSTIPEKSISLVGYSLGVRIIYYGMESWDSSKKVLKDAILLGGAVARDKSWGSKTSSLAGRVINIYNSEDQTLSWWYKTGELYRNNPCGLKPIKEQHHKIINVDVTSLIGTSSHSDKHYLGVLPQTAGKLLW